VVTSRRDKLRTIHVAEVGRALARFRTAHGQIAGDVATAVSLFAGDRIAVR
jgi:hypothetical protein